MEKFKRLVQQSKELTPIREDRALYVAECLINDIISI